MTHRIIVLGARVILTLLAAFFVFAVTGVFFNTAKAGEGKDCSDKHRLYAGFKFNHSNRPLVYDLGVFNNKNACEKAAYRMLTTKRNQELVWSSCEPLN